MDAKRLVNWIPGDPKVVGPVALIIAFTFLGFAFLLTAEPDTPTAVVASGSEGSDPVGTVTQTTTATSQTAAPPPGDCSPMAVDQAEDWLYFPRQNPERMYSKEGYKFSYHLSYPDHIQSHGIAIERPGNEDSSCFQERFFCAWDGVSDAEGQPDAGFEPKAERDADKHLHFGVAGFILPEKEREGYGTTYPYETFSYVAYALTMDGTYLTTPLDGATLGQGLLEVRYHNVPNNAGHAIALCDPIAAGVVEG